MSKYNPLTDDEREFALNKLESYMRKSHILQCEVADTLGICRMYVSQLLRRKDTLGIRTYRRLVTYLKENGAWE